MTDLVLSVEDLNVWFEGKAGAKLHAVRSVSLGMRRGERLGLVGESGSGKTSTAMAVMGLLPATAAVSGAVVVNGNDMLREDDLSARRHRWVDAAMIFQDAMNSFNPVRRIGRQFRDTLELHGLAETDVNRQIRRLLNRVGLNDDVASRYPHELSGGMRQRAMLAVGLSCRPSILIADEPTTALDVVVQAQILDMLERLAAEDGLSVLLITHDLSIVAQLCDRAAVMYAGRIVESGSTRDLYTNPRHPYTAALVESTPTLTRRRHGRPLPGSSPLLSDPDEGCAFAPRCPHAMARCRETVPKLIQVGPSQLAACFLNETNNQVTGALRPA